MINSRLKRIDIYSRETEKGDYVGKRLREKLLGYVYADVQPLHEEVSDDNEGKRIKRRYRLIMRPDAGVSCGDLAAIFGKAPDFEIREIIRYSTHISAEAVSIW